MLQKSTRSISSSGQRIVLIVLLPAGNHGKILGILSILNDKNWFFFFKVMRVMLFSQGIIGSFEENSRMVSIFFKIICLIYSKANRASFTTKKYWNISSAGLIVIMGYKGLCTFHCFLLEICQSLWLPFEWQTVF